jgi:hypothetical protein
MTQADELGPAERLERAIAAWRADEARARREVAARVRAGAVCRSGAAAPGANGESATTAAWDHAELLAPLRRVARRHASTFDDRARANLEALAASAPAPGVDPSVGGVPGAIAGHLARAAAQEKSLDALALLYAAARKPVSKDPGARDLGVLLAAVLTASVGAQSWDAARALEVEAAALVPRLLELRAAADAAAAPWLKSAPPRPDLAPAGAEPLARARALLAATDDPCRELVAHALRLLGGGSREVPWHLAIPRLLGVVVGGSFTARGRYARLGAGLVHCAPRGALERLRVEEVGATLDPRARVTVAPGARVLLGPDDVRILASGSELGLAAELGAAEALGRALALSLASPALPVSLRLPLDHTTARAVGVAFAQLLADTAFLRRTYALSAHDAENVALAAATLVTCEARVCAAATCARAEPPPSRVAAAGQWLRRALARVTMPDEVAALLSLGSAAAVARSRARDTGLALYVALRERFDEDWWRNPRVAEALAALGARGGALSAEAALAELGVEPERCVEFAARRVVELGRG